MIIAIKELLIAALSHLAWPTTVLLLAWMFRDPLHAVLQRLESASFKQGKLTLGSGRLAEKLARAEGMADALTLPQSIIAVRKPSNPHEEAVKLGLKMAAKQPHNAIRDSWQFLVDSTCERVEAKTGNRPVTAEVIASAANFVESGVVSMMTLLMSIPNDELSGGLASTAKDEAVRYVNLISRVHQRIVERTPVSDAVQVQGTTTIQGVDQ